MKTLLLDSPIRCRRCGGVLYSEYEENYCLACGAWHDSAGNLMDRLPSAEESFDGKHQKTGGRHVISSLN